MSDLNTIPQRRSNLKFYQYLWHKNLLSLLSGGLLPLAFAPFGFYPLAMICPALLLYQIQNLSGKQAFITAWFFGLGFFGVGVSWVSVSIYHFAVPSIPLTFLITAGFLMFLALYPASQCFLLNRFFPEENLRKYLIAFPALWAIFEWIRGWFLTGLPWLFLGYSQINSPFRGYAPVVGNFGIAFLLCFSAGLLLYGYQKLKQAK